MLQLLQLWQIVANLPIEKISRHGPLLLQLMFDIIFDDWLWKETPTFQFRVAKINHENIETDKNVSIDSEWLGQKLEKKN
jgi:hypothetical protein